MERKDEKIFFIILSVVFIHQVTFSTVYYRTGNVIIDTKIDDYVGVAGANVTLSSGGIVDGLSLDHGVVTIDGGEVLGSVGSDHPTFYIKSGTVWGDIYSSDHGNKIDISGGNIHGILRVGDTSTITIRGTGFNYDYGMISAEQGHLTGVLANGDPIDVDFLSSPYASSGIILVIPEPATMMLLGLGGLAVLRRRKRQLKNQD